MESSEVDQQALARSVPEKDADAVADQLQAIARSEGISLTDVAKRSGNAHAHREAKRRLIMRELAAKLRR